LQESGRNQNQPEVTSLYKKILTKYVSYCQKSIVNLDAPINKFITHLTWFFVYIVLLLMAGVTPLSDKLAHNSDQFAWFHGVILFYSASSIVHILINRYL